MDTNNPSSGQPNSQGPVVGIIVVLIVIVIGAFYFFSRIAEIQEADPTLSPEDQEVSESDDIDSIEGDLEAEDFEDLDAELRELDAQLQ